MKKIFCVLISIILLTTGCNNSVSDTKGVDFNVNDNIGVINNYESENPIVAMKIKNYGTIIIELYPSIAPNTVNNFISLIKSGFYDGNTFHRLVKGFVLQGGDPLGNGTGGPGYQIQGEFTSNGFTNTLKHTEGILSMARSSLPNTAGSQFFICLDTASNLDGSYAGFGKVIDGMDIIHRIENNALVENSQTGKLKNNIEIEKVIVDLKGKEYDDVIKN